MNSGMNPNLIRSTGWICSISVMSRLRMRTRVACVRLCPPDRTNPIACVPTRRADHLIQPDERPAADEEDVRRIDRREFLMRMLAAALRRNIGDGSFENLQQRLLHTFARNVRVIDGFSSLRPILSISSM